VSGKITMAGTSLTPAPCMDRSHWELESLH
jgi:hypothetical protein